MTYAKAKPTDKKNLIDKLEGNFTLTQKNITIGPLLKNNLGIEEFYNMYYVRLPAGENLEIEEERYTKNSFEEIKEIIQDKIPVDNVIYGSGISSIIYGEVIPNRFLSCPKVIPKKGSYTISEFILESSINSPSRKWDINSYSYGEINGGLTSYDLSGYPKGPRVMSS